MLYFVPKEKCMTVLSLDQQALALLISLRDNPEIQKNSDLFKMFNDTISFALKSLPPQPLSSTHELSSLIRIDTSGQDGEDGLPRPKAPNGSKGVDGSEGTDGENARDINLQLKAVDGEIIAQWDQGSASMKFGDIGNGIALRAVGGGGGKGGRGGQGGVGLPGADGDDATEYSSGSDGENGKPGRVGGNGGDGGNGGKGGDVKIFVSSKDSDLLMLLNSPEIEGGEKGRGGEGGTGGKGGKGGEGGSSYSGSKSRLQTRTVYNGGIQQQEMYTSVTPIYNVGGVNGSQGKMGETGKVGTDGRAGMNGSFQTIVEGVAYSSLYDLALTVSKNVDVTQGNPDGVYEPGETVHLTVSVSNVGNMPTPPQEIEISLDSAPWMAQGASSLILGAADHLLVGRRHTFATPFSFRIQHQHPCIGEPLDQQVALTYQALLRRVNKVFPRIKAQKDLLQIRYPVQISPLQAKVVSIFNDETILNLSVQNVASIIMGITGPQKRRVFVTFEIEKKDGDIALVKIDESDLQEPNKITSEVNLAPKSEKQLTVKCRFDNQDLDSQPKKVGVVASLFLDYFKDEQSQGARCIQQRTIQIQSSS